MELRATFDYLTRYYDRREYRQIHAVFLMGILRVADYLQIQPERATAKPSIQQEVDSAWAAFGEVYGRYAPLNRLGLVIRRIRSNLGDRPLLDRLAFVPLPARLTSAGSDLLQLLVGPLYGDDPAFGVCELIQNAVDACNERADWQAQRGEADHSGRYGVRVRLEEHEPGRRALTVSDEGIASPPTESVRSMRLVVWPPWWQIPPRPRHHPICGSSSNGCEHSMGVRTASNSTGRWKRRRRQVRRQSPPPGWPSSRHPCCRSTNADRRVVMERARRHIGPELDAWTARLASSESPLA